MTSKAALIGELKKAFAYCDGAYDSLTDANGQTDPLDTYDRISSNKDLAKLAGLPRGSAVEDEMQTHERFP